MSTRTLARLAGAAGVLLSLWLVMSLLSPGSGPSDASGSEGWASFFTELGADGVSTVEIREGGELRTLTRSAGSWTINGFPTDSAVVDRFWSTVASTAVGDLVATNPENHARMGVVPDSALAVTFGGELGSSSLLVGTAGNSPGSAYARRPDEDGVYLLTGGLRTQLARSVSDWRDKRILNVDTARVDRVVIDRPEGSYTLARSDSTWTVDGGEAQPVVSAGVLEELATMRGTDFLVEGDSLFASPTDITVTAISASGDTLGSVALGAGERDRSARIPTTETVYRVPNFRIERIAPERESLLP